MRRFNGYDRVLSSFLIGWIVLLTRGRKVQSNPCTYDTQHGATYDLSSLNGMYVEKTHTHIERERERERFSFLPSFLPYVRLTLLRLLPSWTRQI